MKKKFMVLSRVLKKPRFIEKTCRQVKYRFFTGFSGKTRFFKMAFFYL